MFQVLLLTVVLRKSLDVFKLSSLTIILFMWALHWLASKRAKGLIGEECRNPKIHARMQLLYAFLIVVDCVISTIFILQFNKYGSKMNDIYVIIGFEVSDFLWTSLSNFCSVHAVDT